MTTVLAHQRTLRMPDNASFDADALVEAAERRLGTTPTGASIVTELRDHDVPIVVQSDKEFYARHTDGTRGLFDPRTGKITVPYSTMVDPEQGAIMLAHEGTHAVEWYSHRGGKIGWIAGEIAHRISDGITAPFHLANPVTAAVDAGRRRAVDSEVRAYTAQAHVADELGVDVYGIADFGHNDDGTIGTDQQIRKRIEQVRIYREVGPMRTVRAGATGFFFASLALSAVQGVAMLTDRKLPVLPVYSGVGAITAAVVAHDWLTHRNAE